jgi:hypothetical protein
MSCLENRIEELSIAARPTLFDAVRAPDLLISLILANLMSPSLWDFRDQIEQRIESSSPREAAALESIVMREIQSYVDKHLFHVSPLVMPDVWGLLDLQEEQDRIGAAVVDYAVSSIVRNLEYWRKLGVLRANQDIVPLIESGRFPEYEYSTIDVIRAHRRHLGQKKHKPLGVTCCADEAVLIASLATVLKGVSFVDLIILGAPIHYTTLLQHDGQRYWFNGKQECFDQKSWQEKVANCGQGTVQKAFDRRAGFDRLITPAGNFLLSEQCSTMSPDKLESAVRQITAFFGTTLQQLGEASLENVTYEGNPLDVGSFVALDQMEDSHSIYQYLKIQAADNPGTSFEASFYSFRDIFVRHPEAYLAAALRGHKTRALADKCDSFDDAVKIPGYHWTRIDLQ